jgi:hypothetical protein
MQITVFQETVAQNIRSQRASALEKVTDSKRRLFVPVLQNPLFTGRESIITQISESFKISPHSQQCTVLIGLGGVGKTQIATAFIHSALCTSAFSKVFWTFANSRSQVIKSFTEIAKNLGVCTSVSDSASRTNLSGLDSSKDGPAQTSREVNALLSWMSQECNNDWILVFDNLDDLESFDIREFIPKVSFGHILITSRRQHAARLGTPIDVDVMNDGDALDLLYKCSRVPKGRDESKARELIGVLGNLPLAIDQAGAYIADGFMEFEDYLLAFETGHRDLLSTKPPASIWDYEHTVYTTWEISVKKVETMNPLAVRILGLAANFDSHDIPVCLVLRRAQSIPLTGGCFLSKFYEFADVEGNYDAILGPMPASFKAAETEITAAIGMLVSFSLVQRMESSKNLIIHPLVHAWLNDRAVQSGKAVTTAHQAICLTSRAIFNACNLAQFGEVQSLYSQVLRCDIFVDEYPELLDLVDVPKLGGCIIAIDAWVPLYVDPTTLERSDRFYEIISKMKNRDQWQIPDVMWQIRTAYRLSSQGLREELHAHCEDFFQAAKSGDKFSDFYRACMAQVYGASLSRQLKYQRMEQIYSENPTDCDESGYMLARKNLVLGSMKLDFKQLDDAEKLLRSCESVLRRRVGSDFFLWTNWHLLMAQCRLAQGRAEEAEQICRLMMQKRLDSLDRGNTILNFSDWEVVEVFAKTLRGQGRYDQALGVVEDVLLKTNSPHPPLARVLGELTFVLTHLERLGSLVCSTSDQFQLKVAKIDFEAILQKAHLAYERAFDAYEIEWTRGLWAFNSCPSQLKEIESRFRTALSMQRQDMAEEETPASSASTVSPNYVELKDEMLRRTYHGSNDVDESFSDHANENGVENPNDMVSEPSEKVNTNDPNLSDSASPASTKGRRGRRLSNLRNLFQ